MRLLLLPGMGDIHWVALKLESWLERRGIKQPEVWVWDFDGRPRSIDFVDRIPFVKRGGYHTFVKTDNTAFNRLYYQVNQTDAEHNFLGFDALIGTNGNMRNGIPFANIMEGASVNYDYGPELTDADHEYGIIQRKLGPYFVLCFSNFGMFSQQWFFYMPPAIVRGMLDVLKTAFPRHRFIFTGCKWDGPYTDLIKTDKDHTLLGKTSTGELLGLLQHSEGFLGWCGGNSIVAQHLGVPTVVWWSKRYFPLHDRTGWEHPASRHLVLEVENYKPDTPELIIRFLKESR